MASCPCCAASCRNESSSALAGIKAVAARAGVSTATVSRAMRGLPNVTPGTRERVLRAARELGYWPSPAARSLASGRTRSIGLLTPWVHRWFNSHVIDGAERELRAHNFDVLLHTFNLDAEENRAPLDAAALSRRVDGVLVVGIVLTDAELERLAGLGVPIVFIGPGPSGAHRVFVDDDAAIAGAAGHLAELGHRVVAHVGGRSEGRPEWSPPVRRRRSFLRAAAEHGFDDGAGLFVQGNFTSSAGRRAVQELLGRRRDLTGIVVDSDEMAFGVLAELQAAGLKVPGDVSVISVDGVEVGELLGLTTMAQDAFSQGVAGARMILDLIAGNSPAPDVIFSPHLIARSSTGPVRLHASTA